MSRPKKRATWEIPSKTSEEAPIASKPEPKIKIKADLAWAKTVKLSTKNRNPPMIPSMETTKKAKMTLEAATRIAKRAKRMAIPKGIPMGAASRANKAIC